MSTRLGEGQEKAGEKANGAFGDHGGDIEARVAGCLADLRE
jgi:hypothetical protein